MKIGIKTMKLNKLVVASSLLLLSLAGVADNVTYDPAKRAANGQTADANDINDNFDEAKRAIETKADQDALDTHELTGDAHHAKYTDAEVESIATNRVNNHDTSASAHTTLFSEVKNAICSLFNASLDSPAFCNVLSFRHVFITSDTFNGRLGGNAGADALCQAISERPSAVVSPGTYKAWITVHSAVPARERHTHSNVPYMHVGGAPLADDWSDLTDGSIQAAAAWRFEDGVVAANPSAHAHWWTGTGYDGDYPGGGTCQGFLSNDALDYGGLGSSHSNGTAWTYASTISCDTPLHLICIQQ